MKNEDAVLAMSDVTLKFLRQIVYNDSEHAASSITNARTIIQQYALNKLPLEVGRSVCVKWEEAWCNGKVIEGEEGEGGEKEINLIEYSTGAGKTDIQQLRFDEGGDDWDIFDDWYYI